MASRKVDAEGNDLPTRDDEIRWARLDMERLRETEALAKAGYPVVMPPPAEMTRRLVELSLRIKRLEAEASAEQNKWHDEHDL